MRKKTNKFTLENLEQLLSEYLATLDDNQENKWYIYYTTDFKFAKVEISKFLAWLKEKEKNE